MQDESKLEGQARYGRRKEAQEQEASKQEEKKQDVRRKHTRYNDVLDPLLLANQLL